VLKKELKSHYLIMIVWLWIITILRFNFHLPILNQLPDFLLFWLGGLLGTMLPDLDQFIYALVSHSEEYNSLRIKRTLEQGNLKESLALVADTSGERTKLVFHNVLFQIILIILCFFVLSSTNGLFGKGLVMAMFLHLLKDEIRLIYRKKEESLRLWLFWIIKKEVSLRTQKYFVYASAIIFFFFSLFLI
jgi:hypothetical protein